MSIIPEKQENQKQVLTLNELSKRKVVEHNSLITSIAKMDKTPLKIFELAVSCINTEEPPKDNIIYLSKAESKKRKIKGLNLDGYYLSQQLNGRTMTIR